MPNERAVLCGSACDGRLPFGGGDLLRLRRWGPHRNIRLTIDDVREALWRDIPPLFLDLLDLGGYVYTADQAVPRGAAGVDNLGADWRRRLFFRVPVSDPDFWNDVAVRRELESTLSFLSEDEYHFEFVPLREDRPLQRDIDFNADPFSGTVDEVIMFSGGLDSLAGAVREAVARRRKIALVRHRSNEKLTPRHRQLLRLIESRAGPAAPVHFPVRINKVEDLGREPTQRARSFLYAALGATFARMLGRDRLWFCENGVVSLNLPPSAQVVGARATRTTHPQVLAGFSRLLGKLTGSPFAVENPFLWLTKTDIVRAIADAGCADAIGLTTSCGHTRAMTRQHPHCGVCSQCIDRRFAVLAAGQQAHDPAEAYAVDLLLGPREGGNPRTMLSAYVETANAISRMDAVRFFARFGEASRVLRHVGLDADETARRVFDLYRRHAEQVCGVVDDAIGRFASSIRQRELPASCLVRLASDGSTDESEEPSAPVAVPPAPRPDNFFRRKGQVWDVRFAASEDFILLPSKGAAYLHALLAQPNVSISALDLACRVSRNRNDYALGDAGEKADRDALSAYRSRFVELQSELDAARADGDQGAEQRAREEMQALTDEIRRAKGLGGRLRRDSDDRDRIRKAVGAAIRRVVRDIRQYDAPLAEHLTNCLTCGLRPRYSPSDQIEWSL